MWVCACVCVCGGVDSKWCRKATTCSKNGKTGKLFLKKGEEIVVEAEALTRIRKVTTASAVNTK